MSLIKVNGLNPFNGQSDPYLSMDSKITYENNNDGQVQNTYTLQGNLTGCDKNTLAQLRDNLINSFDWKKDISIPSNIEISGVITSNENNKLIPSSLSFESSNYIGALPYTLTLDLFTGYDYGDQDGKEKLIFKTHTETTTIDEKGCTSISTNISCRPNENLTGCDSIELSNQWIKDQLGHARIGAITRTKSLPLQDESLTINPITSEISYSSVHAQECNNTAAGGAPNGSNGFQLAFCTEESNGNVSCPDSVVKTVNNGEVYKSGVSENELLEYLNNNLLSQYKGVVNFSANYSNSQDNITFSFEQKTVNGEPVFEPKDLILNNYSISKSKDHDAKKESTRINGDYSLLNPVNKTKANLNALQDSVIKNTAKSLAGPKGALGSSSIARNTGQGTIDYSYAFSTDETYNGSEVPSLNGISGLRSYSISYTPTIVQYKTIQNLNCDDLIVRQNYNNRGSLNIAVNAISGSGYDFLANGRSFMSHLINSTNPNKLDIRLDSSGENFSETRDSVNLEYSASFASKTSSVSANNIRTMY
jgi:hypothetical protein